MSEEQIELPQSPERRNFLRGSGLAAIAAAISPTHGAALIPKPEQEGTPASPPEVPGQPIDLVNVLQGTDSTYTFSRGNTLPIAAVPFGMAHWTLQSDDRTPWMFHPGERRLQGLRCTHQLSPWLSDYGQAIFLPFSGDPNPEPQPRSSSWRPEQSDLHPYSFRFSLLRYEMDVELVPTTRCAAIAASNRSDLPSGFLIEIPAHGEPVYGTDGDSALHFTSTANEGGVPENFATYYVVRFSQPWDSIESKRVSDRRLVVVRFKKGGAIEARIATSFISFDQARKNLERELGSKALDQLRADTKSEWSQQFSRLQIEGATERQQRTFYSCLYRALLFPRIWHELDDSGKPQHFSPYSGKLAAGFMYADHGYWDVYRAWYPFMSLVYPERLAEILQAWVNAYTEGGWLPQFPAPGYRACMTGSLIDSVFGDAAAKGIRGFDLAGAYGGLKKHATEPGDPDKGYGRRGIEEYLRLGYCSVDHVDQSAAETVDAAYGDFCIAQVAKALGHNDDAAMFLKRSQNWRNLFDPTSGFLRGKHANGSWLEPFDPIQWGNPYVEGSAWQHRWDVPHDMEGLIEAMGGKEKASAALEKMLSMAPDFRVGVYGQEIHEMSEMAAVDFGQYAHSNQPVHHVLYIFTLAGRWDRTQYWANRTMEELYSPDSFAGDEDTGSMAAWYLLSAMGFFPLCPGKAEYVLGKAHFPGMTVRLPNDKTLRIENQASGGAAQSATLNGTGITNVVSHESLLRGGRLVFH